MDSSLEEFISGVIGEMHLERLYIDGKPAKNCIVICKEDFITLMCHKTTRGSFAEIQ